MGEFTIAVRKGQRGITAEEALSKEGDMIPALSTLQNTTDFRQNILWPRRSQIKQLVSRHLGVPPSDFKLSPPDEWITGGHNLCVIINSINSPKLPRRAILRFPLPFKAGEAFSPGIVDEKLRCEAATYIWLRRDCPTVPIPRLLGIGFIGTQSFTAIENESWRNWSVWQLRRGWAWLRKDTLAPYFAHHRDSLLDLGYLLIEYVEDGEMLSSSWSQHCQDANRRVNLYRGLARIMLSLAGVPLPRIGSWTMADSGTISLTNRPLSDLTVLWSQRQIPAVVPRDRTYSSAEPFIHDMLRYQDNRMRHQPNSILSEKDGIFQLSILTGLRTLLPRFWDRSPSGSFVLALADMHQSNIFVDDNWNITRLIDLEFAPVLPVQMVDVPSWLSGRGVDELDGPDLNEYKLLYDEFVDILEHEEVVGQLGNTYSQGLRERWITGMFWYNLALGSINAFPAIFMQHLQPRYFDNFQLESLERARLWDENVLDFIAGKLEDLERYRVRVREIFTAAEARDANESNRSKG